MKKDKLNVVQLEKMKELYMKYESIASIGRTFNVSRTTVNWHINSKSWSADRKLAEAELLTQFSDSKKSDFISMTQSAVNVMARALEELSKRHEPPTMAEATKAGDILKTLDNILRLDEGKPTDIVENQDKPLSSKELKDKLKKDPFYKPEKEDEKKLN